LTSEWIVDQNERALKRSGGNLATMLMEGGIKRSKGKRSRIKNNRAGKGPFRISREREPGKNEKKRTITSNIPGEPSSTQKGSPAETRPLSRKFGVPNTHRGETKNFVAKEKISFKKNEFRYSNPEIGVKADRGG